jgi:hypothetical protein
MELTFENYCRVWQAPALDNQRLASRALGAAVSRVSAKGLGFMV